VKEIIYMTQLPPGWTQHPENPEYAYNATEVRKIADLIGVQPPPPPTVPMSPAVPQVQGQGQPSYGAMDMGVAESDGFAMKSGFEGGDDLWLNFPELPKQEGSYVEIVPRFLPPWAPGETRAYVLVTAMWVPKDLFPNSKADKAEYVVSYNNDGGPGNCPVAAAVDTVVAGRKVKDLDRAIAMMRPKTQMYWQALNMRDPRVHCVQRKDLNTGMIMCDAQGQPTYEIKPAFVRIPQTLYPDMLYQASRLGTANGKPVDFTFPDARGFSFTIKKQRKGSREMDVKYDAYADPPSPIPEYLLPVLRNLVDLRKRFFVYKSAEEMQQCAQNILSAFGRSATSQVPQGYPTQSQQPSYGQLYPGGAPQPPAPAVPNQLPGGWAPPPPAQPQMPPPAAYPGAPQQPVYPAPQQPPAGYPGYPAPGANPPSPVGPPPAPPRPPGAPTALPPVPQGGYPPPPAVPPAAAVSPPGSPPPGMAPPPPGMPPGVQAMSPEEFEAQMRAGGPR
jgi:hypothetical protein